MTVQTNNIPTPDFVPMMAPAIWQWIKSSGYLKQALQEELVNYGLGRMQHLQVNTALPTTTNDLPEGYWSKTEVSNFLRIGQTMMSKLVAANKIPHRKIGKKLVFKKQDV